MMMKAVAHHHRQGSSLIGTLSSAFSSFSIRSPSSLSSSPLSDPTLEAFEIDLRNRLDQLKDSARCEGSYINLPWLTQALSAALATNCAVEELILRFDLHYSEREDWWISQYMDDSAKLLDACNSLKEKISDTKEYHAQVQLALDLLDARNGLWTWEAKCQRARKVLKDCILGINLKDGFQSQHQATQFKELKPCNSILRRMAEKLAVPNAKSQPPFVSAIYAAKVNTIFVCSLLEAALSFNPRWALCNFRVPNHFVWSTSLITMHQNVKDEISRKKPSGSPSFLQELHSVDALVRRLRDKIDEALLLKTLSGSNTKHGDDVELIQVCERLREQSEEVGEGLGLLEQQMNELFEMLINSRLALLDLISHSKS